MSEPLHDARASRRADLAWPASRRRRALIAGSAAAALGVAACSTRTSPGLGRDPFTLGVASGYPSPGGVVLWTRLAPDPLHGGGMGAQPVEVQWELAHDEAFARIAASGSAMATADEGHCLHIEVTGLAPGRPYWYRFTAASARSPVGRTRTAPPPGAMQPLRIAFGSCQHYEQGWFSAYRDLAAQAPDLMLHLGDYIYESSWGGRHLRSHHGGVPTTLEGFRNRWALYKSDPDLQAAHAALPWCLIWDDHEVANDYTDDVSPVMADPARFLAMRAAAYRAWWEHLPVPRSMKPHGPAARIHGHHRLGALLDLVLLDGRQHRSHHVCLPGRSTSTMVDCAARHDVSRSLLGPAQEAWFDRTLAQPAARWTLIAQTTLMAEVNRGTRSQPAYWMDGWDGFPAARQRLLDALSRQRPRNVLVASGDVHAFYAAELRRRPDEAPLAAEFAGGSITSQGAAAPTVARLLALNPHLSWGRADRRGYALLTLTAAEATVEFRAVDDEKQPGSATRTLARFAVADGEPGLRITAG